MNEPLAVTAEPDAAATDGRDSAIATLVAAQIAEYAPDVRWSAPRRGLSLQGRTAVAGHLRAECAVMCNARVTPLRTCGGPVQSFDEFSVRFHLGPPGIEGLALPVHAEVELERLRVLTRDAAGLIVVETCIETWTWLSGPVSMAPRSDERGRSEREDAHHGIADPGTANKDTDDVHAAREE